MDHKIHIPENLPLLPLRDTVVFPYMLVSLYIGRDISKKAVQEALNTNRILFLITQKNAQDQDISSNSVFKMGTAAIILRTKTMKDGRLKVLIQGLTRGVLENVTFKGSHYQARIQEVQDLQNAAKSKKTIELVEKLKTTLRTISNLGGRFSPDLLMILDEVTHPGHLADLIAGHFELKVYEMQNCLELCDPEARLKRLLQILNREVEIIRMQNRIKKMVKNRFQNDPFFQSQGGGQGAASFSTVYPATGGGENKSEEIRDILEKMNKAQIPEAEKKEVMKQVIRLEKMHPESSEASLIRGYLDWVVELPWSKGTKDNLDLQRASRILEQDHFGLHEVKERILEFLAVRQLKRSDRMKGPILCFTGPPGVGKTSLGKSIATAMGRKYFRIALGGVKDEAEIRGHRRTYVGAMPGKIIQALKNVGSFNPILVLDEVDKLGSDFRGDPSAALLEVLDPEQNFSFRDHYLNLNFDLSRVMFIATANVLENIPSALRDRMEIISISGYTLTEKMAIAKKYIIKKQMDSNGIHGDHICFEDQGIKHLINSYTKEAGVRNLYREVGALCRKAAMRVVTGKGENLSLTSRKIEELLGPARFVKEDCLKENKVGVSTGLAWTGAGGEILYVEALRVSTHSSRGILLTGRLGKVMEESAQAAFSYVRMYSEKLGVLPSWFKKNEIHVHLPAGAVPKDGPSAGVTLATALISLISNIAVRKDVAMTGEIGLQGQVLPVGGIKEKCLAALNQGIVNVILPAKNRPDIENANTKDSTLKELREKMNFIYVENLDEVFKYALEEEKSSHKKSKLHSLSLAS